MTEEIIKIENLEKTFYSRQSAVKAFGQIDLTIHSGDIFGIIGPSGAGKSTLVRCINYLERPTGGKVFFDGRDLDGLNEKELNQIRQSIGMIFQQFHLLMQRSVLDNVCFPMEITGIRKRDARKRAAELLEIVGLSEKKDAYPAQLSGGQKQRVAIARSLANNPKVLLCDEATSALDPETTRSILSLLKDINQRMGITIVVITHEMSVVENICNRVAILDEARLAETGNTQDVFSAPRSEAGRRLVFKDRIKSTEFQKKGCLRITFDGRSSFEPVIADMILECNTLINIMYADTRDIDGRAMGHMLIQLPAGTAEAAKVKSYMKAKKILFEEVDADVMESNR